jgi:hypothetical protein
MKSSTVDSIHAALMEGRAVPYLGPGVLSLGEAANSLPSSHEALAAKLTAKTSVPFKIRKNLTAAAQFIENFKHRKTVTQSMLEAFRDGAAPTVLHNYLASLPSLPLVVHAWYDDLPQRALAARDGWGMVQGISQAEHFGTWVHYFGPDGSPAADSSAWRTLLYQPFGSVWPASNFLVSDSDFVEVLTEIDIQTPIPEPVQRIRAGRNFLFLGCRFAAQLERLFARQIMKRSSDRHWAVLPEEPTRNEARFLELYGIERVEVSLPEFVEALEGMQPSTAVRMAG